MEKNDWFLGFLVGILLITAELGYFAQYLGLNDTVSGWVKQLTVTLIAEK